MLSVLSYQLRGIWVLCHSHPLLLPSSPSKTCFSCLFSSPATCNLLHMFLSAGSLISDWKIGQSTPSEVEFLSTFALTVCNGIVTLRSICSVRSQLVSRDNTQFFDPGLKTWNIIFVPDTALRLTARPAPYFIVLPEKRQEIICRGMDRLKISIHFPPSRFRVEIIVRKLIVKSAR